MLRDKVFSMLQRAWSSTTCSVDLDAATDRIVEYIESIKEDYEEAIKELESENRRLDDSSDYWEEEAADLKIINEDLRGDIFSLETEVKDLNDQLDDESNDSDSCEVNLTHTTELLEEALPELTKYLEVQSNNPNKYRELNQLLYRIDEQIRKNGE